MSRCTRSRVLVASLAAALLSTAGVYAIGEDDSLMPRGANPDEPFTNTVFFDPATQTYEFAYWGSDTILYTVDIDDTEVQAGLVRVGARINWGPTAYPITDGGTRYRLVDPNDPNQTTVISPAEFAAVATITLDSHSLTDDRVALAYSETLDPNDPNAVVNQKTFEFWIQGKTLILHATSLGTAGVDNYAGFSCGRTDDTPDAWQTILPYAHDPAVVVPDGRFLSCYLDRGKCSGAELDLLDTAYASDSIAASFQSINIPDSAGQVPPLDETVYITVSDEVLDVLAKPNHAPSAYRSQLVNRVVLDVWHHDKWYFLSSLPSAVRREWVSPRADEAHVFGFFADSFTYGSDGVYVRVLHNEDELWGRRILAGDNIGDEFDLIVPLAIGDTLAFLVEPWGNEWDDWTDFEATITFADPNESYNSIQGFDGVQGANGWYYRQSVGGAVSDLIWAGNHWSNESETASLNPNSAHPPKNLKFDQAAIMLGVYAEYGMSDLLVLYHMWKCYGQDRSLPVHYPADEYYGGSAWMAAFTQTARDLDILLALHENYTAMHAPNPPDYPNPLYEESAIAKNPDLSFRLAAYNPHSGQQGYRMACNRMAGFALDQASQIRDAYAPNATYLDYTTGMTPFETVDFDASNPTPKTLAEAIRQHKLLFEQQKSLYEGPLLGEGCDAELAWGRYDDFYAGYLDGVEREIRGRQHAPLVPDYELHVVKPMMVNHGMGYPGRFYNEVGQEGWVDPDVVDWDRYRAMEIAYGHAGFMPETYTDLDYHQMYYHFPEYYLLRELQARYLDAEPVAILYEHEGQMLDLSTALLAEVDFQRARVSIEYDNGLNILVNRREENVVSSSQDEFGYRQGQGGWYYQEWTGSEYQDMVWDCDGGHWQGTLYWCQLDKLGGHPHGTYEPARRWVAPVDTVLHIYGTVRDRNPSPGDGVIVSIHKNDEQVWSVVLENGETTGIDYDEDISVAAGDAIYFRIFQRDNLNSDHTYFLPTISYVDPNAAEWVVTTPMGEYHLPPMGWVAWNAADEFLEYLALLDGERAEFVRSPAYVYARARTGSLQTIESVTTDGAVAITSSGPPGTRDIHMVQGTQAAYDDAPYGLVQLSQRGDVNIVYEDQQTAILTVRNVSEYTVDVTYGDLPDSWRDADGTLRTCIDIYQLDSDGSPIGPAIPWDSPSGGYDLLIPNLIPDTPYRIRRIPGDLDGDWDVDLGDLTELLGHYGTTSGASYEDGDLDGDGDVDLSDLTEMLSLYGTVCIACPGDITGDNVVNLSDLTQLLGHYGTTSGAVYMDGDLDFDGDVDLNDLTELLGLYGTTCE